ncbi:MAG: class I SAM-dependent methyltransferase [Cyanobacteria bacterium SID2]|nr:class I SAM-dependent methyltransferase [Cyanobacteria bacterium SID2]MBP0002646.1 class I SAM-dependent methyltransferase [Cyanobacteria bacterium SBC]
MVEISPNRRAQIRQMATEADRDTNPSRWFERVYASANGEANTIPWAILQPNPLLLSWLEQMQVRGDGQSALVIGCGLGDDAEALAQRGFRVTAFDISDTAIEWCRQRFPDSPVDYRTCDLFACAEGWTRSFDFVFESRTVQSLPLSFRRQTVDAVCQFVADEGTLLVIANRRNTEAEPDGPPWPLSDLEFKFFEDFGLTEIRRDRFSGNTHPTVRIEYRRAEG